MKTLRRAWPLLLVTALGLALRLLWAFHVHPPKDFIYSDMASYVGRARNLLAGHYDAYDWMYPPGTSVWFALAMKLAPNHWEPLAAAWQVLLSTAEIPLVYVAVRRFYSARLALACAACFALHFFSIEWCGVFLSENYVTFGLILSVALFDPRDMLKCGLSGLALGLGALAKPQVLMLLPFWGLLLLWRRRWDSILALGLGALALVAPGSYAASKATGHFQTMSAMGGVVMVQAWCPVTFVDAHLPGGGQMGFGPPDVGQRSMRGEQEATWGEARYDVPFTDSKFYFREGLKCISRFPGHALRTLFLNFADTFAGPPWSYVGPWPDAYTAFRTSTVGYNLAFSWLVLPVALAGMWLGRREEGMLAVATLPFLSNMMVSVIFHGEPRLRIPYDFTMWIAACYAVAELWARRARRRAGSGPEPIAAPPVEPAAAARAEVSP